MADETTSDKSLWEPLERHVTALGWVVVSWCELYEELGLLFVDVINPDKSAAVLAAWHEVRSDRTQRHMLLAAVKNTLNSKPSVRKYIRWAIGQIDEMENARNNAVHAPVETTIWSRDSDLLTDLRILVQPRLEANNPRANQMGGYDLEKLFRIHHENTNALILFIRSLRPLVRAAAEPDQLPKKPSLQSTQQAKLPTPQNTEEPPLPLPDATGA